MEGNQASSGGISFVGLLTVLFIGLKLSGFIAWSWLWVLAPMWISAGIGIVIVAGVLLWAWLVGNAIH